MADLLRAVPRPRPGVDLRELELTAEQAYVYTRLDGMSTVADVCAVTGLGEAATIGVLRRLQSLGLIVLDGLDPEPAAGRKSVPSGATPRRRSSPPAGVPRRSTPPVLLQGDPAWSEEFEEPGVGISPEKRKRILTVYHSLATTHFYALLGVPPSSDRKAI